MSNALTSLLLAAPVELDSVATFQRAALAHDVTLDRLRADFDAALIVVTPTLVASPPMDDLGRRLLCYVAADGEGDNRGHGLVAVAGLLRALAAPQGEIHDQVELAAESGLIITHRMGKYIQLTRDGRLRVRQLGADLPSQEGDADQLLSWLRAHGDGEERGRLEIDQHAGKAELGFGPNRFRDAAHLLEERGLATVKASVGRFAVRLSPRGRLSGS